MEEDVQKYEEIEKQLTLRLICFKRNFRNIGMVEDNTQNNQDMQ